MIRALGGTGTFARQPVVMFGASLSNVNCVDEYGGLPCHSWEWSGSAWTRVWPVDLFGDVSPAPGWARSRRTTPRSPSGTGSGPGESLHRGRALTGVPASDEPYGCIHCATAASFKGDTSRMPTTCPTRTHPAVATDPTPYRSAERQALMRAADRVPFTEDGRLRTRVEELVAFARARGIRRVGVAFCVSLLREAQELGRRLGAAGLEASLVCCRVGAIDHDEIALPKAHPEKFAAICNPVGQARLLNAANVGLVAQVGLCLGHDLVLQEECDAPVTTLVVKDRALDHHPVRALRDPGASR